MNVPPAAWKDALLQHKSSERGCFHPPWKPATSPPNLYHRVLPCSWMKLRPNVYYCLFSLIANMCLSLNNHQSVVLKYFSHWSLRNCKCTKRVWVSVVRSIVCHCHWAGPKWPCVVAGSPREEFNWSPGNWKLLSAHHLCFGLVDHQHRPLWVLWGGLKGGKLNQDSTIRVRF